MWSLHYSRLYNPCLLCFIVFLLRHKEFLAHIIAGYEARKDFLAERMEVFLERIAFFLEEKERYEPRKAFHALRMDVFLERMDVFVLQKEGYGERMERLAEQKEGFGKRRWKAKAAKMLP